MAKCEICEKTAIHGNKLSITRSHISKRAPRTWKPNLRTVKAEVDGEIKRNKNHEILSTKSEKNHGLGLPRIKSIIEKSGGVLQITSENNIFSVHIILPDKENKIE